MSEPTYSIKQVDDLHERYDKALQEWKQSIKDNDPQELMDELSRAKEMAFQRLQHAQDSLESGSGRSTNAKQSESTNPYVPTYSSTPPQSQSISSSEDIPSYAMPYGNPVVTSGVPVTGDVRRSKKSTSNIIVTSVDTGTTSSINNTRPPIYEESKESNPKLKKCAKVWVLLHLVIMIILQISYLSAPATLPDIVIKSENEADTQTWKPNDKYLSSVSSTVIVFLVFSFIFVIGGLVIWKWFSDNKKLRMAYFFFLIVLITTYCASGPSISYVRPCYVRGGTKLCNGLNIYCLTKSKAWSGVSVTWHGQYELAVGGFPTSTRGQKLSQQYQNQYSGQSWHGEIRINKTKCSSSRYSSYRPETTQYTLQDPSYSSYSRQCCKEAADGIALYTRGYSRDAGRLSVVWGAFWMLISLYVPFGLLIVFVIFSLLFNCIYKCNESNNTNIDERNIRYLRNCGVAMCVVLDIIC